jgi:hypothetical protein
MSWKFLRENNVKAKKSHKCLCCGESIEKGANYIERVGVDDVIISMKMHIECEKATSEYDNEDWEIFEEYSLDRPVPLT